MLSNPHLMAASHRSVWSEVLGTWEPGSAAAKVDPVRRRAGRSLPLHRGHGRDATRRVRQIRYGTAALALLKLEFLKNAQVVELSNEEALQECLRAQVPPFWPMPNSDLSVA